MMILVQFNLIQFNLCSATRMILTAENPAAAIQARCLAAVAPWSVSKGMREICVYIYIHVYVYIYYMPVYGE